MKKLLSLLCLAALAGNAQPYGEQFYAHPNILCGSGTNVTVHTKGFVIGSYVPSAVAGSPNFYVDKTGPGGVYAPLTAFPFSQSYIIRGNRACATAPPQAKALTNVDVVESVASANNVWYAVGGAYEEGCFYTALGSTGNVLFSGFYRFPSTAVKPSKVTIVESVVPTEYYLCGSFFVGTNCFMYVNRIKETGVLISSVIYTFPNFAENLEPADMVMSTYAPVGLTELVIVGKATDISAAANSRGFAMRIDANNLSTVISYREFGHAAGATGHDAFGSIIPVNSANTTMGFVVGGTTDASPNNGNVWFLKLNTTCTNFGWNSLIRPVFDPVATLPVALQERKSGVYGFTYYGAVLSQKGMLVLKLNDAGLPFTAVPPIDNLNEFLYAGVFSSPSVVRDLSYIDNATNDVGIQVYGTDPATGGNAYFVEAAFNGDSDVGACTNSHLTTGMPAVPGPTNIISSTTPTQTGLPQCTNFFVTTASVSIAPKVVCTSAALPPGGSNNRTTGIAELHNSSSAFVVSPNPVTDRLDVTFSASVSDNVDIRLYDYTGRYIQSIPVTESNSNLQHVASLNMSTLSIESGIYIISATINGVKSTQKIVYTKGQ